MCGIFGSFDQHGAAIPDRELAAMAAALRHRGPDDHGVFQAPGVAIGNQRLSIIDLAGGHQPFVSADGRIAVVQNGEIYNYRELAAELATLGTPCRTTCDTEVILRWYEREGIACLRRFNGMFAIAVWDARERAVYLGRDRLGVKPLFVHGRGGRWWFASEIKGILAAGAPRALDAVALHHLLSFNYVPPPWTLFSGISHLMPGHWMRLHADGVRTVRWWDLADQAPVERPESAWIEEIAATLDDAVRLRMRADVPFGAFLSGGVDSSSVVGSMRRHQAEPVHTFAIGFHEERFDESPFAAEAAQRFATIHACRKLGPELIDDWPAAVWHCDQPHGDVSFLPMLALSRMARDQVKMVLTGDGGDELFAGYEKYAQWSQRRAAQADDDTAWRDYHACTSVFTETAKQALYTTAQAAATRGADAYDPAAAVFARSRHLDRTSQLCYLDCMLLLPGNNLVKPDRTTMAAALEARDPFLDPRLVELAFRMPGRLKLHQGETKHLLKRAVAPLIGHGLAYRAKTMFTVPIGEWFKDRLRTLLTAVLCDPRSEARGLFRPAAVRALIDDHLSGSANRTRELRLLIAIELWQRTFIDALHLRPPSFADLDVAWEKTP